MTKPFLKRRQFTTIQRLIIAPGGIDSFINPETHRNHFICLNKEEELSNESAPENMFPAKFKSIYLRMSSRWLGIGNVINCDNNQYVLYIV